jgi:DNA-3-methyladenine glycosylase
VASEKVGSFKLLQAPVEEVARRLIGCYLEREIDGWTLKLRIVEIEAYDQTDAASHSYKGRTQRTGVMFGPAGHLYVYFTYGMHYCCNIVVGESGYGAAVLIRALEPLGDIELLERRRGKKGIEVTNGPAKICQALGIDKRMNGHDLHQPPLRLIINPPVAATDIVVSSRIGISQAKDIPWRFYLKGNPYVSKRD